LDETNLNPKYDNTKFLEALGYEVETKEFEVDLETAIERDLRREFSVGEKVIRRTYNQYIQKTDKDRVIKDKTLPNCILCDIDGTLARKTDRSSFDWKRVGEDEVIKEVAIITDIFYRNGNVKIILFSGRDAVCREETEKWLSDNVIYYNELYMRAEGDIRKDSIIKKELFFEHINGKYNVDLVIDDRIQVLDMWCYDLGLFTLNVNQDPRGLYEF
jgi:hypothetical protein